MSLSVRTIRKPTTNTIIQNTLFIFPLVIAVPADPGRLATAVTVYLLAGFAGVALFGERAWLGQAETFSVFFRMISWLSPLAACAVDTPGRDARLHVRVGLPALRLLAVPPPPPSGVAFILLALAAVSFDGISRTFTWLALVGVNPLAYPGRTALIAPNTAGLVALSTVLALGYVTVVWLADRIARMRAPTPRLLGTFVLAIVPIACGYHVAHYLPVFLVDVQYALRALSDLNLHECLPMSARPAKLRPLVSSRRSIARAVL